MEYVVLAFIFFIIFIINFIMDYFLYYVDFGFFRYKRLCYLLNRKYVLLGKLKQIEFKLCFCFNDKDKEKLMKKFNEVNKQVNENYNLIKEVKGDEEMIKFDKENLSEIIKWTSSKFNEMTKAEVIEKILAMKPGTVEHFECETSVEGNINLRNVYIVSRLVDCVVIHMQGENNGVKILYIEK